MYSRYEELLKERGLKTSVVARDTNITNSTFTAWRKGEYTPKIDKLKKIADYFGVSVHWLSGESNERNPTSEIKKEPKSKDMDSIIDDIEMYFYEGSKNISPEQRKMIKNIIEATLKEDDE